MKIFYLCTIVATYLSLGPQVSYGQCTNQVSHGSGTQEVNDIDVTVTSNGNARSAASGFGCTSEPANYSVSHNSIEGSFTFSFSRAVESLSLNFFRLDASPSNIEEIQLFVDGSHYAIPSAGSAFENCELFNDSFPAIITSEGNIRASQSLSHGSMKDLVIPGPVNTLTVFGKVALGRTSGVMFSLYICDASLGQRSFDNSWSPIVFPNPFSSTCEIKLPNKNEQWFVNLVNPYGQILKTFRNVADQLVIDRDNLAEGIYFLQFKNDKHSLNTKIIIKN